MTTHRLLAAATVALTLAACSSDSTAPTTSVVGSYQLQTVNGVALPYTQTNGDQIASDSLQIRGDGTYTDVTNYIPAGGGTGTETVTGTWSGNSGAIRFTGENSTSQGSLSGSVLTVNNAGLTGAYRKQ